MAKESPEVKEARKYLEWVKLARFDAENELRDIFRGAAYRGFQLTSAEDDQVKGLGRRVAAIDVQIRLAGERYWKAKRAKYSAKQPESRSVARNSKPQKIAKKSEPVYEASDSQPCECGCGFYTSGGRWRPGHNTAPRILAVRSVTSDDEQDDLPQQLPVDVLEVEDIPQNVDHAMADTIQRRAEGLISWNYRSIDSSRRHHSRRYEGFGGSR